MKTLTLIIPCIFSLIACLVPAQTTDDIRGKVTGISDGDTIKVLVNKKETTIRLDGIDAPEANQSFGSRSKQALSGEIFGREVVVKSVGEDRYGRTLGVVFLRGKNINAKMVENGWAWHYKEYSKDTKLAELEEKAKAGKRGLWADSNPLPPWEFRNRQKKPESADTGEYWLNLSSKVRHNQKCQFFKNSKRGRMCGPDEGKACGICGG